jgi:hypothetical protein
MREILFLNKKNVLKNNFRVNKKLFFFYKSPFKLFYNKKIELI